MTSITLNSIRTNCFYFNKTNEACCVRRGREAPRYAVFCACDAHPRNPPLAGQVMTNTNSKQTHKHKHVFRSFHFEPEKKLSGTGKSIMSHGKITSSAPATGVHLMACHIQHKVNKLAYEFDTPLRKTRKLICQTVKFLVVNNRPNTDLENYRLKIITI